MIKSEVDGAYLITHSYGEVIDGITWDESSAKFLVDKLNERCKKVINVLSVEKAILKLVKKRVIKRKSILVAMDMVVDVPHIASMMLLIN